MTQPAKPLDPLVAELISLIRLLIEHIPTSASADLFARLAALEAWKAESAGVYPTVGGTQ